MNGSCRPDASSIGRQVGTRLRSLSSWSKSSDPQIVFDHVRLPKGLGQHLAEGWKRHCLDTLEKYLAGKVTGGQLREEIFGSMRIQVSQLPKFNTKIGYLAEVNNTTSLWSLPRA
ncbi:MAG: hypothetical protein QOJ41_2575 [Acidobacteriaceae bacterium]|jgi:hypothetical protein|nr:hypothetical protein [Acidobacteriaceae bacterium]